MKVIGKMTNRPQKSAKYLKNRETFQLFCAVRREYSENVMQSPEKMSAQMCIQIAVED